MNQIERLVANAFQETLEIPRATRDADFFELGGDSFAAVALAIRIEEIFPVQLPVELLEDIRTVSQLAAWIDANMAR